MKNTRFRKVAAVVSCLALVASLMAAPLGASANSSISNDVDSSTNWTVPSSYKTNTVEVDGTLYKVITTWANAWALSGPDYIGVSNSGTINQSGGSSATSDLEAAATTTMLGIWASAVNEVPNAYNWNYFYNLALDDAGEDTDSEQVAAIDVQNGADSGYDTSSGVYACFKYRPEVIWTSNSLSGSSAITYATQIRNGQYYTDGELVESGSDSEYYIDGDEDYDPYIVVAGTATAAGRTSTSSGGSGTPDSAYTLLSSLYILADYCEAIEDETASYNSDGSITASNVTWKTMNSLPRTTRYEASSENAVSAREAALDVEKLMKGAVYYTLAKIADGTTTKKTVAVVTGTIDTTGSTTTIVDFGGGYEGQRGSTAGKIGGAALAIDCLTTDTVVSSSSSSSSSGSSTGSTYTATADELLEADYIFAANGSLSVEEVESWLTDNVTSSSSKAKIGEVEILTDLPAFMNGHNFTFEKAINMVYDLCFFYPELFPDLELVSYWYDNVYHINYDDLSTCLLYGLGNATMPSGVEVSKLPGESYSNADIDAKAAEGYEYYAESLATQSPYADNELIQPTDTYAHWVEVYNLSAALAEAQEALAAAEEELAEAQEQLAEAREQLEEAEASQAELEATVAELEEQLAEAQDALTAVEEQLADLTDSLAETQTALAEAQAENAELQAENAELQAEIEELEAELEETSPQVLYDENLILSATSLAYTGSSRTPTITVMYHGETLVKGTDYTVSYSKSTRKAVGTYKITVTGTGDYSGTVSKSYSITKATNPMTVQSSVKTVKRSKVKKAAQKVKALTVSKAQGSVTYTKTSGSGKLTVNSSTGKVTVKKGTAKGVYTIKVKVKAAGNSGYQSASETVSVTVVVS